MSLRRVEVSVSESKAQPKIEVDFGLTPPGAYFFEFDTQSLQPEGRIHCELSSSAGSYFQDECEIISKRRTVRVQFALPGIKHERLVLRISALTGATELWLPSTLRRLEKPSKTLGPKFPAPIAQAYEKLIPGIGAEAPARLNRQDLTALLIEKIYRLRRTRPVIGAVLSVAASVPGLRQAMVSAFSKKLKARLASS